MYFDRPGKQNTQQTIELAVKTAKERGIRFLVIATSFGDTLKLVEDVQDLQVVAVTHAYGFEKPNENEFTEEKRAQFVQKGIKICTAAHVLSGAERALSNQFGGVNPVEIMAHTLRMFGQGVKVCVEIAVMAADAGMIPTTEPVIAVGGSGRGADTAVILQAANANRILSTKIDEIICKPIISKQ